MNILVTGAAGYIGSVITEKLISKGNHVLALDNLTQGHKEAVVPQAEFIYADLVDIQQLEQIFVNHRIDAVMHLAANTLIGQSMKEPAKYFQNNVFCGVNLLNIMIKYNVLKLIFSSSCAIYGEPEQTPISESQFPKPINPYGESKLVFEKILYWYAQAYDLCSISLRYFNAAGATERLGEDHDPETHLIPNALNVALKQIDHIPVFGIDYPTKDGSCIRDYIHVADIAKAHILALEYLGTQPQSKAYNLGHGKGYSVLEVIETVKRVSNTEMPVSIMSRRNGDPAILVASSDRARKELGWQPDYPDMERIVASAWEWKKKHPGGYRSTAKDE
jgi:UDP-glucose 4-epimerase